MEGLQPRYRRVAGIDVHHMVHLAATVIEQKDGPSNKRAVSSAPSNAIAALSRHGWSKKVWTVMESLQFLGKPHTAPGTYMTAGYEESPQL